MLRITTAMMGCNGELGYPMFATYSRDNFRQSFWIGSWENEIDAAFSPQGATYSLITS
jgi:hypothetical protein